MLVSNQNLPLTSFDKPKGLWMCHIIENIKIDLDIILSLQKVGIVSENG
jgi:hypothetical protein